MVGLGGEEKVERKLAPLTGAAVRYAVPRHLGMANVVEFAFIFEENMIAAYDCSRSISARDTAPTLPTDRAWAILAHAYGFSGSHVSLPAFPGW